MQLFLRMLMLVFILVSSNLTTAAEMQGPKGMNIPAKNTVTMVDLGAKKCIPCKLMAPILEELKEEYKGRAEVIFIDVWEDRGKAKEFKVVTIPTQIFFNREGQEVYRHIGFLDKESIVKKLEELLAM